MARSERLRCWFSMTICAFRRMPSSFARRTGVPVNTASNHGASPLTRGSSGGQTIVSDRG